MTSQSNESITANSFSSIFKKPKPLMKVHRKKQKNQNSTNSIDILTSLPGNADSRGKNAVTDDQYQPKNLKNSFNFFNDLTESTSESVNVNKVRRTPFEPKKSLKVSFSRSVNASNEDSMTIMGHKMGYLRKLRKSTKPTKDANFSSDIPTIDESTITKSTKNFSSSNHSNSKDSENASPAILSLSFSPPWNSSLTKGVGRIRRCSTPLEGISRSKMLNTAANLSLIPRALPFSQNEMQSSSSTVAASTRNGSKDGVVKTPALQQQSTDSSTTSSSCSASFVSKVFHKEETIMPTSEEACSSPPRENSKRIIGKTNPDFRLKSVFPKFAPFCDKRLYQYFIYKMKPKYGIETNRRVVRISQKVHYLVESIISKKTNYQQFVQRLQKLLFRRNIIQTCYDFYLFSLKFLPGDAVLKIVPLIKPFGLPLLASLNCQTVFDTIKFE